MNPETASAYAFIGDCLKNGQAIEKGEMAVDELGVKATDDATLEVTLEHPTSYFLSLIGSSGEFAPIRQDIVEKYGTDFAATADKNVYCGPFVMTSSENNVWIFEKNENYWNKDSIKLDRCELNYVENAIHSCQCMKQEILIMYRFLLRMFRSIRIRHRNMQMVI